MPPAPQIDSKRTSSEPSNSDAPERPAIASFPSVLETNPYQRLLYEQLARYGFALAGRARPTVGWLWRSRREVGFLHFHWPQGYWSRGPEELGIAAWAMLALFCIRLAVARVLGYRIVWTVHQVTSHEARHERIERLGARALAGMSHLLIAHEAETAGRASAELGRAGRRVEIVPHGSYIGVYPPGRSRDDLRRELGLAQDAFVFLSFGDVRAYKQTATLVEAFRAARPEGSVLVVAGSAGGRERDALVAAAGPDPAVKLLLRFVPADGVAELFAMCDAAVVARGDGGTSGSLILAMSLGVPSVAARKPVYVELLGDEEAGWLFAPGDVRSLGATLIRATRSSPEELAAKRDAAVRRAQRLEWEEIGARTAQLFLGAVN